MKFMLILLLCVGAISCNSGAKSGANGQAGAAGRDGANGSDGTNGTDGQNADESRVAALEQRVSVLESLYAALQSIVSLQGTAIASTQANVDDLEVIDAQFQLLLNSLTTRIDALEAAEDVNAGLLAALRLDVTALQDVADTQITELVDPCGDGSGWDEVLLRLGDGRLVAYFESAQNANANRFLTVLSAGSYQTTDAQHCHFSVSASNVLSY